LGGSSPTRAFTLIELLVVLSILAMMAALTIGGILRSRTTNRLLATEHLVADCVRQARHTARSSGAPVLLKITRTKNPNGVVNGGQIAGVSRLCIWSESFDENTDIDPPPPPPAAHPEITVGQSGHGRKVDQLHPCTKVLTRQEQLVRGGRTDGFYLACAVHPPPPPTASSTSVDIIIPLLLIGADDKLDNSLGGILLQQVKRTEQIAKPDPNRPDVKQDSVTAMLTSYEILGWIRPDKSKVIYVSSVDALDLPVGATRDEPVLHDPSGADKDIAGPLEGERWVEIGMLFADQRLTLYRNGQRVGERSLADPALNLSLPISLPPAASTVFVGQATLPNESDSTYSGFGVVLDDARLYRLGTDQLGQLPAGVIPDQDYRIVVHPDGRVEAVSNGVVANAANATTMTFTGPFTNTANRANVWVTIDGRVTSTLEVGH
jgi:prepilin-type N-terminal cleavage/methylation domain-containing protein